jgi:hypothetical protein
MILIFILPMLVGCQRTHDDTIPSEGAEPFCSIGLMSKSCDYTTVGLIGFRSELSKEIAISTITELISSGEIDGVILRRSGVKLVRSPSNDHDFTELLLSNQTWSFSFELEGIDGFVQIQFENDIIRSVIWEYNNFDF